MVLERVVKPGIGLACISFGTASLVYFLAAAIPARLDVLSVVAFSLVILLGLREVFRARAKSEGGSARAIVSSKQPRFVELADLPEADPNLASVFGIPCGAKLYVIYGTASDDPSDPSEDESCAVVMFNNCESFLGRGPNDEAIRNHPLYGQGLMSYTIQEVCDSPWVDELVRMRHKDGLPLFRNGQRHFLFALKEGSLELTAGSYSLVGQFSSYGEADEFVWARIVQDAAQHS